MESQEIKSIPSKLTALVLAIQDRVDLNEVLDLINNDPELPLTEPPPLCSPLHWAAHCDETEILTALFNHPLINIDTRDRRNGIYM